MVADISRTGGMLYIEVVIYTNGGGFEMVMR